MTSTFTPSTIDLSVEKDWPANLGMLDWDNTNIVFTKRSLVEFLKYTGTTVDPNFTNIAKLPRYAQFGKLSSKVETAAADSSAAPAAVNESLSSTAFKPTRRVRTVPGGPHTELFGHEDEDDALSTAPPKPHNTSACYLCHFLLLDESGINFSSSVKPSRRVRTNPGGNSSMSSLWDPEETPEEFKPTRRVRQGPGGEDHIGGIF
ncbi:hypothetical protein BDQ12DRAFT_732465 [Crucibulum laeve]|uniref:Uncharacterized protein n=1 Tax=Crucibulum laeve TaxID=68775 RepID=A0A5C3MDP0_9AGAR|nr:hypothetical protein BDQ12DRAFT_732465 [Crucibulum laeve]